MPTPDSKFRPACPAVPFCSRAAEAEHKDCRKSTHDMPRKPTRRGQLLKPQPLTFSPFARSLARIAYGSIIKHQAHDSKINRKPPPDSAGNGLNKYALDKKSKLSESFDEEVSEGVVQADFAFFDPKPDDFHGVKTLLQTYLDDEQWDLSGFVDLILGQPTVGTVIKIEDDEDNNLFSVITALNLGRYKDHKCIMELKQFLLKVCREKDFIGEQAQNVGLLVSQRVVNLPLQLLPPLYDALFDEVSWATEDEPTEELRNSFCFKYYLIISRIYKHKNADQEKRSRGDCNEATIYIKPEDEIFHKLSSSFLTFPLHTQQHGAHELRNYKLMGLLMIVEADKVSMFRQQLQSLIDES